MHIPVRLVTALAIVLGAIAAPTASAASCASGTTSWTNTNGGAWNNSANWDHGVPSAACDARIVLAGDYGVLLVGSSSARSLTIGAASGGQRLVSDTRGTLHVGDGGITLVDLGGINMSQGTIDVSGAVKLAGGSLNGAGQLTASGGVVNSSGRVVPATDGVLRIVGSYEQDDDGTFLVAAPPASSSSVAGQLSVSGATNFGGRLVVTGSGPAKPGVTTVVTSGDEREGFFKSVSYGDQPYDAYYTYGGVGLVRACAEGSTEWTNPKGGNWYDAANWSNGRPLKGCDARITLPGTYTVVADDNSGEGMARSLTLGGTSGTQTVAGSNYGSSRGTVPGDGLDIGAGGITVGEHGALSLYRGDVATTGSVQINGGLVEGMGDLTAGHGVINTSGVLSVPADILLETLRIHGAYTQGAAGTLAVRLGFDCGNLAVDGQVQLDGALTIDVPDGESFDRCGIVDSGTNVRGKFSSVKVTGKDVTVHYDGPNGGVYVTPGSTHTEPSSNADTCVSGTTSWINANGGAWNNPANWDNGVPSAACAARIVLAGDYGVLATGGGSARSLVIGAASGGQRLVSNNTGTLHIGNGSLAIIGQGGINMSQGTIEVASTLWLAGGSLNGDGTISAAKGVVNSGGRVVPTTGGVLRIQGTYRQTAGGTFLVNAPSGGLPGQLSVTGTTKVGGNLVVIGAAPAERGLPKIITSGNILSGRFSLVSSGPQRYDASYLLDGSVRLARACVQGTTSWVNRKGGDWYNPDNWSNGRPTKDCNARITLPGTYTVYVEDATDPAAANRLTLGGRSGRQSIVASAMGGGAGKVVVGSGGITIGRHGRVGLVAGGLETLGRIVLRGYLGGHGEIRAFRGVVNTSGVLSVVNFEDGLTIRGSYLQGQRGTLVAGYAKGCTHPRDVLFVDGRVQLAGRLRIASKSRYPGPCDVIVSRGGRYGRFAEVLGGPYAVHYTAGGRVSVTALITG